MKKYAYAWITIGFFLVSLVLHWVYGWKTYVDEAREHGQVAESATYLNLMMRDTFENWQSEFLQLLWQVVGLAYFLYVGSPASKESGDRAEAKLDALIRLQAGERGDDIIRQLDERYLRGHGHAKPHAHGSDPVVAGRE
ncbi:DUF6766 family protein [Sphingomonas sp.]|jgi:hypothetical protein|uniref:DUF6766 family protein n=1 Tax=Sphingomonas sp. TaxID=28214 RepID=UPI002EDAB601